MSTSAPQGPPRSDWKALARRHAGSGSPAPPSGPFDVVAASRAVAFCLLRSTRQIGELVGASQLLAALAARPPSERGPIASAAIAYASPRAVLLPAARAHLESAAALLADAVASEPLACEPAAYSATDADDAAAAAADLERAGAYIDRHLDWFDIAAAPRTLPSIKALGELAAVGEVLCRGRAPARGARWLEHVWKRFEAGAKLEALIDAAPRNALLATVLPPLARAGFDLGGVCRLLARQVPVASFAGAEWVHLLPALAALELEAPSSARDAAAAASLVAARPMPWLVDLEGIYQLTHEVFYASKWGGLDPRLGDDALTYLRLWLPVWCEHFRCDRDSDVVAELLAAARIVGAEAAPTSWSFLAESQGADGSVAPPIGRRVGMDLDGSDAAARYHPTLVAMLAWAL